MRIKDIAQYEDTDSELAKYTITILQQEIERLQNIIKEVRELVENGTDFKSIYFKKDKEDLWKVILSNEIKEKYLEILDKGSDEISK